MSNPLAGRNPREKHVSPSGPTILLEDRPRTPTSSSRGRKDSLSGRNPREKHVSPSGPTILLGDRPRTPRSSSRGRKDSLSGRTGVLEERRDGKAIAHSGVTTGPVIYLGGKRSTRRKRRSHRRR